MRPAAGALAALLLGGCSTLYDLTGRTPVKGRGPHVYGGIRTIAEGGGFIGDYRLEGAGNLVSNLPPEIGAIVVAPVVADLVLSVVFDTLLLPVTIPHGR